MLCTCTAGGASERSIWLGRLDLRLGPPMRQHVPNAHNNRPVRTTATLAEHPGSIKHHTSGVRHPVRF